MFTIWKSHKKHPLKYTIKYSVKYCNVNIIISPLCIYVAHARIKVNNGSANIAIDEEYQETVSLLFEYIKLHVIKRSTHGYINK